MRSLLVSGRVHDRPTLSPCGLLFVLAVALLGMIVVASPGALAAPSIVSATVSQHKTMTRITLVVSEKVPFQAFTLNDPDRVVIDLPDVDWALTPRLEPQASGLFERLRHGRFRPGTSRVVIDCNGPVVVRDSVLVRSGDHYRLIVDLDRHGAAAVAFSAPPAADPSPPVLMPAHEQARDQASAQIVGQSGFAPVIGATGLAIGDVGPAQSPSEVASPVPSPLSHASLGQGSFPASQGRTTGQRADVRAAGPLSFAAVGFAPKPRPNVPRLGVPPRWVIAIDAGHGGQDPGAIAPSGVYEKQITLAAARALRDELQATGRYKVVLTRNRDVFIRLRDRIAIARAAGADLFVSLHADSMTNRATRGLSVYTLSERASDAEAAALAERENKVDFIAKVDFSGASPEVTNILIDLVQRETMNDSARLASLLVRKLAEDTELLPKTHRFAGFAVLKAPDVPSALIELGYLSNPADERLLRGREHQRRLASAIVRAVDGYFVRVEARGRP